MQKWTFPSLPAALPPFRAPRGLALCDVAAVTRHGLRTPTRDLPHDRTPWDEGVPGGVRGSVEPGAHELHVPANLLTRIRQLPVRTPLPSFLLSFLPSFLSLIEFRSILSSIV